MDIEVSRHAIKRAKERMGLNKDAIIRLASLAFEKGKSHSDTTGSLHRYLDKVYLLKHEANNMKIYGEFLYLFSNNILVTIFKIDNKLKKCL